MDPHLKETIMMDGKNTEFERKRNRLKHYDYSTNGSYFVTVCAENRRCIFGTIYPGSESVELTPCGKALTSAIEKTTETYPGVEIPEYVIMPNHVHMIIELKNQKKTVSQIVSYFKWNASRATGARLWQKSFYDHVIRNEKDYLAILEYMAFNPKQWVLDKYYKN